MGGRTFVNFAALFRKRYRPTGIDKHYVLELEGAGLDQSEASGLELEGASLRVEADERRSKRSVERLWRKFLGAEGE